MSRRKRLRQLLSLMADVVTVAPVLVFLLISVAL